MRFYNIHSVAKYQKIEGGPFGDFTKMSKKKTKNENFQQFHSAEKSEGTAWDFLTKVFVLLQNIKHRGEAIFYLTQIISKSSQPKVKGSYQKAPIFPPASMGS